MGSIYRQTNSKNLWVKYYRNGKAYRESSGSPLERVAKRLLRLREGDIERGLPVTPKVGRVTFEEAAADVVNDYSTNGKRSLKVAQRRLEKHLAPFFGGWKMATSRRRTSDVSSRSARATRSSPEGHGHFDRRGNGLTFPKRAGRSRTPRSIGNSPF